MGATPQEIYIKTRMYERMGSRLTVYTKTHQHRACQDLPLALDDKRDRALKKKSGSETSDVQSAAHPNLQNFGLTRSPRKLKLFK